MATQQPALSPLKKAIISSPEDFHFGPVRPTMTLTATTAVAVAAAPPAPSLGPLAAFVGDWAGSGFNTIFRPDNSKTPTALPIPVTGSDNILELNLTTERLSFSKSLGSVPNRGTEPQGDVMLNGVPYLQVINDVTDPLHVAGIHLEPGLWIVVPTTADPAEGQTVARMASIPHGTTIQAQGTSRIINGPPTIPKVDITPNVIGNPLALIPFPSQKVVNNGTPRIPQDLGPFAAAGKITQAMLDDPNSVLRNHIAGQKITSTTEITISTNPPAPLFGGGADNIAFLLGDQAITKPNAQAKQMTATFWIETVEHTIHVPVFRPGQPAMTIAGEARPGLPTLLFTVHPPVAITTPRTITFTTKQIQYTQTVILNFATLSWPHVSVATLVPSDPIPVPPSAWA